MHVLALGSGNGPVFLDLIKDGQTMLTDLVPMAGGRGQYDFDLPAGTLRHDRAVGVSLWRLRPAGPQDAGDLRPPGPSGEDRDHARPPGISAGQAGQNTASRSPTGNTGPCRAL